MTFDAQRLDRARHILSTHAQKRTMPGAVGLVLQREGTVAQWTVGQHTYEPGAPSVQPNTIYDLASVTKVVVTTTLAMLFSHNGQLDLDAPAQTYVPSFVGEGKNHVTARHLLTHSGGLPAHVHLYKQHDSRDAMLNALCDLPLNYEPGTNTIYSDMGFLLLGMILEAVGKDRLDRLAQRHIFNPLQMPDTSYCPSADITDRIPPTEFKTNLRTGLVHGEVHDENAAALGGIAPHAGLFATAEDLGRFLRAWLNNGILDGARVFPAKATQTFITRAHLVPNSTYALGWDTVSPGASTTGRHFSERSFGSLGFTGTSIWADPERNLGVILLTNRVHPTRDNDQIKQLRPEFHDAISEALRY